MNAKIFLISGIVGGIVDFLLGWLFYGILFKDTFPTEGKENMLFIFLGCMTFGLFVAYIFTKWAGITTITTGLQAGAIIGLFIGVYSNFFMNSMTETPNLQTMGIDIAITMVMSAIVGATVALVHGKMK
jgi:hypothetical protein